MTVAADYYRKSGFASTDGTDRYQQLLAPTGWSNLPYGHEIFPKQSPALKMCHSWLITQIYQCHMIFMKYLKSCVYDIKPCNTQHLKRHIHEELAAIPEETLQNIITDFMQHLEDWDEMECGHLLYSVLKN
jgi:hypothetical protein